jgi:hypothetical protein
VVEFFRFPAPASSLFGVFSKYEAEVLENNSEIGESVFECWIPAWPYAPEQSGAHLVQAILHLLADRGLPVAQQ